MDKQASTLYLLGPLIILLVLGDGAWAAESQQPTQQAEPGKGLTVEGLARGVRSAAQNIEKEIPKIGAAVGKTIKSIGSNSSQKKQDRPQPTDKK